MERLKVLFHVNEPERIKVAMGNITNLIKDVSPEMADIELVINGAAINVYSNNEIVETMKALNSKGVKFMACRNSLRMLCENNPVCMLNEDTLPVFVEVVPAGVTEIAKKQAEGYAYIKP